MDLERIWLSTRYNYIKFLAWKYRIEYSWKYLTTWQKLTSSFLFGSGVSISFFVIYKYIEKQQPSQNAREIDFEEVLSLTKRRMKGIPPGLYNEGNTCFANSILQALSSFPELLDWLDDTTKLCLANKLTVTPSLQKLLKVLSNRCGNEDVYSASDVFSSLRGHGWVISNEQHDAYEFFQSLLSTVDDEISKIGTVEVGEFTTTGVFSCYIANKVSKKLPTINNTKLKNPFKGSFANKLSCLTCGYQYPIKFQTFNSLILSLEKVSPFECTLESCFETFAESELLYDVCCDNCQKNHMEPVKRTFSRRMSLAKLPTCLCIDLQRTSFDAEGRTLKNPMFVTFPEFLDVKRFTYRSQVFNNKSMEHRKVSHQSKGAMTGKNTRGDNNYGNGPILRGGRSSNLMVKSTPAASNWYRLCAVVLHFGDAYDGHFVTYRRTTKDVNKWVYISDEQVRVVPQERVFKTSAYLLFYEKT